MISFKTDVNGEEHKYTITVETDDYNKYRDIEDYVRKVIDENTVTLDNSNMRKAFANMKKYIER